MKTLKITILFLLSTSLYCFSQEKSKDPESISKELIQKTESLIEGQYIVKFKETIFPKSKSSYREAQNEAQKIINSLLSKVKIDSKKIVKYYFGEFSGFAGKLSDEDIESLKKSGLIEFVEKDQVVWADGSRVEGTNSFAPNQVVDWGVKRVFQQSTQPFCCPPKACGKQIAYVLDTGVDMDHNDLNVHTAWSNAFVYSGLPGGSTPDDAHGHGTHVAGIIGAIDNTIGTRGVAPGTTIVAVKVLSDWGLGTWSDVIWGMNYVAFMYDFVKSQGVCTQVVNLSLGGWGCSSSISAAVLAMANKGIYVTLAAGNSHILAASYSPACTNGARIYTVGSIDNNDSFSSFSNYGVPPVDCAAPGRNIYSTYKNNGYATLTGTSMAAPHVAGILLVNNGQVKFDTFAINPPDSNKYPIAQVCGRNVVNEKNGRVIDKAVTGKLQRASKIGRNK